MLTIRTARRRLQEWQIETGPLRAQPHEEAVVAIPAPALAWGAGGELHGEPLRQILLSAREEGEKALHRFAASEERLRALSSSLAEQQAARDALENARVGVLDIWEVLIEKVIHALREELLGAQLGSLLEEYYRDLSRHSTAVAELPVWNATPIAEEHPPAPPKRRRGRPRKEEQSDATPSRYPVHTSQEWLSLLHTASDGHYQRHFTSDENRGVLRHQRPNAAFFTETTLSDEERRASLGIELLRQAAQALDLDDGFIWLCVSDAIAPAQPLSKGNYAGGWVDLDDVARRTLGGYAPNPAEALRRRRKVWHAIRYGARAVVGGERSVPYFDKSTGQTIDTRIHTTPWQIVSSQQPVQPSLFPDEEVVPVRVELVASREWTALTTASDTAQFLPMGELLGAIPPGQPSGAWARSLGLAYFHWCRLHIRAALDGQAPPPRRELLEQFPPKTTDYETVLNSDDPGRALKYWKGAESYLKEAGFIEITEAPPAPRPRKGWKEPWLEQRPAWMPGPQLRPLLEALGANQFASTPRPLQKPRRKAAKRRTAKSAATE